MAFVSTWVILNGIVPWLDIMRPSHIVVLWCAWSMCMYILRWLFGSVSMVPSPWPWVELHWHWLLIISLVDVISGS